HRIDAWLAAARGWTKCRTACREAKCRWLHGTRDAGLGTRIGPLARLKILRVLSFVIPAQAGIHFRACGKSKMDSGSRLRRVRNDDIEVNSRVTALPGPGSRGPIPDLRAAIAR